MNNFAIGIVLFNPNISILKKNINNINDSKLPIILINNGSSNINEIEEMLVNFKNLNIILKNNDRNMGIAKALNQICDEADSMKCEWALTLDQDTIFSNDILDKYNEFITYKDVAMLCPQVIDRNRNDNKIIDYKRIPFELIDKCITSASLLKIKAWKKVGRFDENMFIDGVDFDICYRLKTAGYNILRINEVIVSHAIGHISERKFLFWNVQVKNHSSFRKYFIARNIIYLARKQRKGYKFIRTIFSEIKLILITLVYEKNKMNKEKAIFNGIFDGISMGIMDGRIEK